MNNKILELAEDVETIKRQLRNLIRVGNVKSVKGKNCVIDFEPNSDVDYCSPPIPWSPVYAGDLLEWRDIRQTCRRCSPRTRGSS